ncbi:hypothetical protein HYFRA_00014091 [Hymenoscyphus fraxineus]|uniref:Uncharacterized protein n=1 Tax=Hymenoscyphus fraxineus TaxID=746836 RepID=A0A9N9LCF3_9HELO|nr:hypothetical protein HYFRA_00014091 [Hymenoscyphus fraxineus]
MHLDAVQNFAPLPPHYSILHIQPKKILEELNLALGRLVRNRYTEYLPSLGGFIVAQDRSVKSLPGFVVYNITDGIMATDISGWFSRWLSGNLTWSSPTLHISSVQSNNTGNLGQVGTLLLGIMVLVPTLAIKAAAAVIRDWCGFANEVSMLVSVIVRRIVVGQNIKALDEGAENVVATSTEVVKTYCSTPDSYTVAICLPRTVLLKRFFTNPRPPNRSLYSLTKTIGWVSFACHFITIGMSRLFVQKLSVALLLIALVLVIFAKRISDDEDIIRSWLNLGGFSDDIDEFLAAMFTSENDPGPLDLQLNITPPLDISSSTRTTDGPPSLGTLEADLSFLVSQQDCINFSLLSLPPASGSELNDLHTNLSFQQPMPASAAVEFQEKQSQYNLSRESLTLRATQKT